MIYARKSFRVGQYRLRINIFSLSSEIYEAQFRAGIGLNIRYPQLRPYNVHEP